MSAVKLEVLKTDNTLNQEDTIKVLELVLERARKGEISNVVIVANATAEKTWRYWKSRSTNYLETIGMLEHAKFDILQEKGR